MKGFIFAACAMLAFGVSVHSQAQDATWYTVGGGTTACGTSPSDSTIFAAIGPSFWTTANPNLDPLCQKTATVRDSTTGTVLVVPIVDKCGGCDTKTIDLSQPAFQQLGHNLDDGRVPVTWSIN